ncbi:MAG: hypothetical protein HY231_26470 [Acidobacteria bacterium]|nr:hypothetical protein [Acidobacteriota bacterium]
MLCPCCGNGLNEGVQECRCGARFVGKPLDEKPVKIKSYGALMNTFGLLALVSVAALTFTKFLAIGAVVVIWSARRAMKLAKQDPEGYGGYRVASAALTMTVIVSLGLVGYTVASVPKFLADRLAKRDAATKAEMLHYQASVLEEYKRTHHGSYPLNEQEALKSIKEALPADYWQHRIRYESKAAPVATLGKTEISYSNFELRSNGPDEIAGTDDDIIMRDGIFYTGAEIKSQTSASIEKK